MKTKISASITPQRWWRHVTRAGWVHKTPLYKILSYSVDSMRDAADYVLPMNDDRNFLYIY